jgi:hypothetical protein
MSKKSCLLEICFLLFLNVSLIRQLNAQCVSSGSFSDSRGALYLSRSSSVAACFEYRFGSYSRPMVFMQFYF